ncbi:nucleotide exchange factor GrpE [Patescibacteria group bacterium]|nr:nucleotide exchange factor GrpE [Patescibacteria group bacterium]MBU1448818.1 nucleotide exchange factor GrpE [Patescibacteria group bacterium]MBU2613078.1 nucleotide exchange factor GrpE [Patescibacteria group bacterium]
MNDEPRTTDDGLQTECTRCAEYLDGWKRCKADYENLIKETDRRRMEFTKYANEELLSLLLPAIDQYETALAFTPDVSDLPDEQQKPLKNWIIGLHAVRDLWEAAFAQIGLEKVLTVGTFDPTVHEAVEQETSDTVAPGDIIKVLQDGWRIRDKLLRPAKVIVATDPS